MIPDAAVLVAHNQRPSKRLTAGCLISVIAYLAVVAVLGFAVLVVGCRNANVIRASVMGAMRPHALSSYMAMLDARVPADERAAFSNAFDAVLVHMQSASLASMSNTWFRDAVEHLVAAQKDKVILPQECAAFCTAVWARTTIPDAPSTE